MSDFKKVYRCSIKKNEKSISFVQKDQNRELLKRALASFTESTNPVDAIFNRPIPVDVRYRSRFVPVGYFSHAMYFSDSKIVPYFEFLFHFASHSHGERSEIELSLFHADISVENVDIKNVNRMGKDRDKILSTTTYKYAHKLMRSLKKIPQIVTYKSVRFEGKVNNHAVFDKSLINSITEELDKTKAKIKDMNSHFEVTLFKGSGTQVIRIEKVDLE
jgi:hypothetical protein